MVFYHPLTFLDCLNVKKGKIDNATASILFLIFHEICGHFKTNINNLENTPSQFYDYEYKIITYKLGEISDSGNIFENFLASDIVNISSFYKISNIKELLSVDLYTKDDFSKLNQILNQLGISNYQKSCINKPKPIIFKDINSLKIPEIFKILYDVKKTHSEEEFNELIENNEDYKLMMQKLEKRYKNSNYKP